MIERLKNGRGCVVLVINMCSGDKWKMNGSGLGRMIVLAVVVWCWRCLKGTFCFGETEGN